MEPYKDVLREERDYLVEDLDFDSLQDELLAKQVVSRVQLERMTVDNTKCRPDKVAALLNYLDMAGPQMFKRFLDCLDAVFSCDFIAEKLIKSLAKKCSAQNNGPEKKMKTTQNGGTTSATEDGGKNIQNVNGSNKGAAAATTTRPKKRIKAASGGSPPPQKRMKTGTGHREVGYIHRVGSTQESKKGNHYFEFFIQTGANSLMRGVSFKPAIHHKALKDAQKTRKAVTISNVKDGISRDGVREAELGQESTVSTGVVQFQWKDFSQQAGNQSQANASTTSTAPKNSITGYIHHLTKTKKATNNKKCSYINFDIQIKADDYRRAVSFEPKIHRKQLLDAEKKCHPIMITNITDEGKDVKLNKFSTIQKNYTVNFVHKGY